MENSGAIRAIEELHSDLARARAEIAHLQGCLRLTGVPTNVLRKARDIYESDLDRAGRWRDITMTLLYRTNAEIARRCEYLGPPLYDTRRSGYSNLDFLILAGEV